MKRDLKYREAGSSRRAAARGRFASTLRAYAGAMCAGAACVGTLLAGCAADRNWKGARPVVPAALAADRALGPAHVDVTAWPADTWWRGYGDAQLDKLVDEALADSPSLIIAQARLRAAQAAATRANDARQPSTSIGLEATRQRYSANGLIPPPYAGSYVTDGQLTLDFSYDIDFWGRNRKVLESARASVQAAEADRVAARLALAVGVARAYFQLDLQYALQEVAQANLAQQTSILDLTRQRAAAGLENTARIKQSEAMVALTRAAVASTEASIDVARSQLAALVGAGPDRGLDLARPRLSPPDHIALPSALPADLLGRRPDVTAERWRVEAAARGIAAAEAAFYPNVNLIAFAGVQSVGLSKLLNTSSAIVGAGPAVHLPVFNRGELQGALEAQQAEYDVSVGQYNEALIDAVRDVAEVVTNWTALEKETVEQQIALEASERAYAITLDRYRAGLDNYLTVLSSQNQVLFTQALRAQLLARRLSLSTELVRALGGGYAPAT
jgi:NodT family efflux transporter outer membrane factor (OMF) lipoprotein